MLGMTKNNTDSFYWERSAWVDYISDRRDITHAQFHVAYFIARQTNPRDGCMWWSVKAIARETRASLSVVEGTIALLDKCRLIVVGKKKVGRQTVNTYMWRMPLDAREQAFHAVKKTRVKTGGRKPRVSSNEITRVPLNETKPNKA